MTIENGRSRLTEAVELLAKEKGEIKDRLLIAYASKLSQLDPQEDLPAEMLDEYLAWHNAISDAEMPYGYGERAADKLRSMSADEASEHAQALFEMFLKLRGWDLASTQH